MSKINIDIFDPATIAELRMRFQTCPVRITSDDYKYLIDVLSKMIDTIQIAAEEIINNKNVYFGISASQNISDIHVLDTLMVKSLPSTFEEDIDGTVANPLYGYIYIVVPSTFTFSITNNGINVNNEFTMIRSELTADKTTQLDVYRTSEIKYLDSPNHFEIVIS